MYMYIQSQNVLVTSVFLIFFVVSLPPVQFGRPRDGELANVKFIRVTN